MTLDTKTLELLESEYVDDLGTSLCNPATIVDRMIMMHRHQDDEWIYQGRDEYQTFQDDYRALRATFEVTKKAVKLADDRSKEHTLLKGFIHQIDTGIVSMTAFFELEDNNAGNFRERFGSYAGYLEVITIAVDGIKNLNVIYSGLVDTNKLAVKYCTKHRKAQPK
jgi:hypothetical protein